MVHEFGPRVRLWADSSGPGAALDSVSPSLSTPTTLGLSLSKIKTNIKKKEKEKKKAAGPLKTPEILICP